MAYIERPLDTIENVEEFFDNIDAIKLLNDELFRDKLIEISNGTCSSNDELYNFLVSKVCETQKLSEDYKMVDTLTSKTHRCSKYHNNNKRKLLHKNIVKCCLGCNKPDNDDDITLDLKSGGIKPKSNVQYDSRAFLIIGGPASGKSSYANILSTNYGAYLLDSDIIKRKIPEYYESDAGAALVHEESKKIYGDILQIIKSAKANVITPVIGKNFKSLMESVEAYQNAGYNVVLILINIDKLEATRRALKRYVLSERYVPLNYVLDICGHEAVASFYKTACIFNKLSVLEIDNNERIGTIEYSRGCNELVDLLEKNGIAKVKNSLHIKNVL